MSRARPGFLVALAIIAVFGGMSMWRRAHRPGGRWVGRTSCSWIGAPRVEIRPGLARVESMATVAHESVHVAECSALGPVAYRWNTLFAGKNLALELPAYCAAARVRLANGWSANTVKATVLGDMQAAMLDRVDSATLHHTLASACPELK